MLSEGPATGRVTTLKGVGAGRSYTDHLPSYYLDGDEPPGRWWGRATGHLGLGGEITADGFHAVIDGKHPATSVDLGRRMGEGSVRGFDATFSAPKSVSVLFGLGDETVRSEAVEAHDAAVNAVLGWIQAHAHTRMRVHGHVMCVDTEGIVAAVFRQHISRRLDPQLHTHAVIANRVLAADGWWLALDARTIKVDQRTLSALYHAALRAELTGRLGVRWEQPEHGIAEIADIPAIVLAEFSQRTGDIDQRMETKLSRFRTDLGRDSTPKERWRLEREAVIDSRPAKRHGITHQELRDEWSARVRRLGLDPHGLVFSAIGRHRSRGQLDQSLVVGMAAEAVGALERVQSSWRPAEVLRELAAVFPAKVPAEADRLVGWLEALSDYTVEGRCVDLRPPTASMAQVRRDGRPITEAAVDRRLTTQAVLDEEERLLPWADYRLSSIGASILSGSTTPILQLAEEIALTHHERCDGSGYLGLEGEAIPFAARIVAVADVYDALTNARPYKPAWSPDKAIAEISHHSGSHFDPRSSTPSWRLSTAAPDQLALGSAETLVWPSAQARRP